VKRDSGVARLADRCTSNYGGPGVSPGAASRELALSEQSRALFRETGDASGVAWALYNLGLVACYQGRYAVARESLQESLILRWRQGHPPEIARCLAALAGVAQGLGQPARAARLRGAAETGLAPLRTPWPPADAVRIAAIEQAARAELGEPAFSSAYQAGKAAGLAQVVDFGREAVPT